jgi:hypothetical protein
LSNIKEFDGNSSLNQPNAKIIDLDEGSPADEPVTPSGEEAIGRVDGIKKSVLRAEFLPGKTSCDPAGGRSLHHGGTEKKGGRAMGKCPPHGSLLEKLQQLPGLCDGIRRNHFDSCLRTVHGGWGPI